MIYPYILRFDDGTDTYDDFYNQLPSDVILPAGSALSQSSPSYEDVVANAILLQIAQQPVLRPSAANYYNIRRGDNLSSIARRYGMTVDDLVRLNGISNANLIKAGGRLRLNNDVDDVYDDPYVSTYIHNRNGKLAAPSIRRRSSLVQKTPAQNNRTTQRADVPPAVRHMVTQQPTVLTTNKPKTVRKSSTTKSAKKPVTSLRTVVKNGIKYGRDQFGHLYPIQNSYRPYGNKNNEQLLAELKHKWDNGSAWYRFWHTNPYQH